MIYSHILHDTQLYVCVCVCDSKQYSPCACFLWYDVNVSCDQKQLNFTAIQRKSHASRHEAMVIYKNECDEGPSTHLFGR